MARQNYGKKIENSNVMLSGITSHKEKLKARGIDDPYIEKFTALNRNCVEKNSEQEKAKGNLKKMTADLMEMVKELEKEMQFCKRVVMTEIPKPLWKEFGIQDRQGRPKPKEEKPPEEKKDNPG